jgi:hypothetical protein
MSVENKIKELLTRQSDNQLTEADGSDHALVMQGSSQKASFETMPGLAGAGRATSAKMAKDGSRSATASAAGDASQPMQGSSKKEPYSEMDEDEDNPGAKAAAPVSKDTSLRPTMGSEAQPMQGNSKKATFEKARYQESSDSSDEVIAEVDIKGELASIFGEDLSEDFKSKATSIFEAAVIARVNTEMEKIADKLEEQNAAALQEYKDTLVEKVDSFLNYVVEQWMTENQVAINNGLRTEITEEFISGLKTLFQESFIDVPEEKYDVLDELTTKVDSLTSELDESINDNIELAKQYVELKKQLIFQEQTEDLAATEIEKFEKIVEGVEFESEELYREKILVIKENYFPKDSSRSAEQTLVEETTGREPIFEESNDVMSKYVKSLSKTFKSR